MKKIGPYKTYTLDEVIKTLSRRKGFIQGYEKEVIRLNLIHHIHTVRTKEKMTQGDLAKKAGMPQSVIARIESGKKGINLDTLITIAHALGKKVQLI
jgi:DNA-binding XRE family transcriptional regulator